MENGDWISRFVRVGHFFTCLCFNQAGPLKLLEWLWWKQWCQVIPAVHLAILKELKLASLLYGYSILPLGSRTVSLQKCQIAFIHQLRSIAISLNKLLFSISGVNIWPPILLRRLFFAKDACYKTLFLFSSSIIHASLNKTCFVVVQFRSKSSSSSIRTQNEWKIIKSSAVWLFVKFGRDRKSADICY